MKTLFQRTYQLSPVKLKRFIKSNILPHRIAGVAKLGTKSLHPVVLRWVSFRKRTQPARSQAIHRAAGNTFQNFSFNSSNPTAVNHFHPRHLIHTKSELSNRVFQQHVSSIQLKALIKYFGPHWRTQKNPAPQNQPEKTFVRIPIVHPLPAANSFLKTLSNSTLASNNSPPLQFGAKDSNRGASSRRSFERSPIVLPSSPTLAERWKPIVARADMAKMSRHKTTSMEASTHRAIGSKSEFKPTYFTHYVIPDSTHPSHHAKHRIAVTTTKRGSRKPQVDSIRDEVQERKYLLRRQREQLIRQQRSLTSHFSDQLSTIPAIPIDMTWPAKVAQRPVIQQFDDNTSMQTSHGPRGSGSSPRSQVGETRKPVQTSVEEPQLHPDFSKSESALLDRLTDKVMRRLERHNRIERERRGR